MDVINDRIIDVGLNALGYLIAGGLGVLMHSVVQQRRLRRAATPAVPAAPITLTTRPAISDPNPNLEFVSFGADVPTTDAPTESEAATLPGSSHRNRREIIRLAREMLEAGTGGDQIKRTLPISQSELALIKNAASN